MRLSIIIFFLILGLDIYAQDYMLITTSGDTILAYKPVSSNATDIFYRNKDKKSLRLKKTELSEKIDLSEQLADGSFYVKDDSTSNPKDLAVLPFKDGKIAYSKVVNYPGKNKAYIREKVVEYFKINFEGKGSPIILNTEDKIIAKGVFTKVRFTRYYSPIVKKTTIYNVIYTFTVQFKDERFKYDINEFIMWRKTNPSSTGYYWGNGLATTTIKESQIEQFNLEEFYKETYRKPRSKLYQEVNSRVEESSQLFIDKIKEEEDDW